MSFYINPNESENPHQSKYTNKIPHPGVVGSFLIHLSINKIPHPGVVVGLFPDVHKDQSETFVNMRPGFRATSIYVWNCVNGGTYIGFLYCIRFRLENHEKKNIM